MGRSLASRLKHAWIVLREGIPVTGDDIDTDAGLYRRLSQRETKDLEPYTRDRMLKMVYYLWVQNPMARSIVEFKKDYVVGRGLEFKAKDKRVQKVLDAHWKDPINRWGRRQHRIVRELLMWGEQIWPVFVQEHTGRVRLGTIDPVQVKEVVVDPLNVEMPIGVVIRGDAHKSQYRLKTPLASFDESDLSDEALKLRAGMNDGECFYFSINKLSNSTRGLSDLIQIVDVLDMYDECQFTRGEKVKIAGNYFFDCKLTGADDPKIKETQKGEEGKLPKPGTVKYHNENVEWSVVAPDMKAADFQSDMDGLRYYILAGARLPEFFFGKGGEVNYATSLSMGAPVQKAMSSLQGEVEDMLREEMTFVLRAAKTAGALPQDADEEFKSFGFPEIDAKDMAAAATALAQTVQGLSTARLDNVITDAEYRTALRQLLLPFGVELTDDDITDELEKNQSARDAEPYKVSVVPGA